MLRALQLSNEEATILTIIADQRGQQTELLRRTLVPRLQTTAARQVAELLLNPNKKLKRVYAPEILQLHRVYTNWVAINTVTSTVNR